MSVDKLLVSVVSPVYKAEKMIEKLVFEIVKGMDSLNIFYEIILVDDSYEDSKFFL